MVWSIHNMIWNGIEDQNLNNIQCEQGRIQDFHLGGRKRLCASTHITNAEPNSLLAGVQGPLKGPGSSRVVLMVSRAIRALFLSILILKIGENTHIVDPILGRARACCAPPPPPLGSATGEYKSSALAYGKISIFSW